MRRIYLTFACWRLAALKLLQIRAQIRSDFQADFGGCCYLQGEKINGALPAKGHDFSPLDMSGKHVAAEKMAECLAFASAKIK